MLQARIIPALLLKQQALVKTNKFGKPAYIGDPVNTVRIFNELEVDELVFLDIAATPTGRGPDFEILVTIADECFMPLAYGGGINSFEQAERIFKIGFEKVVINSALHSMPGLVGQISRVYGSQAVIASIDVRKNFWGKHEVWSHAGQYNHKLDPVSWAIEVEKMGAGEILLTSIDREGTWSGFDILLTKKVADAVGIPVIAHGGAGNTQHIREVITHAGASAVALGSLVVYQQKGMGVLVNFPEKESLKTSINKI